MTHATPNWPDIDTVFLDMDGTLLDLHYDNQVWNEVVPAAYATQLGIDLASAKQRLLDHMQEIWGTIEFYSFDYWSDRTGLDLVALHEREVSRVAYRPGALNFLRWLKQEGKQSVIATNAHPHSVAVKDAQINISKEVDAIVSSQTYNAPKESQAFWQSLADTLPFQPARTLFIDDNEPVLDHAREFGIGHLLTIITPDSQRPARLALAYPSFDHFDELRTNGSA